MANNQSIMQLKKAHHLLIIFLGFMIVSSCSRNNPSIAIQTEFGPILIELYADKAPVTANNFVRYIEENRFENANFYRTVRMDNQPKNKIKIEVIQGGLDFSQPEKMLDPIPHETTKQTGILHKDGMISMARWDPGTASSEFFICIGDQPELDFGGGRNPDGQGFAAFGKVIKGMDVVREIQSKPDKEQMLVTPVNIIEVVRIKPGNN